MKDATVMATEYSSLETLAGLLAYTAVGYGSGFAVNLMAPKFEPQESSDARLWLEGGAQLAGSYLVATEAMRQLMPKRDSWLPPASDASVLLGVWFSQPDMRARFDELHRRYTMKARECLGLNGAPPAPVAVAPDQGEAPEQQ